MKLKSLAVTAATVALALSPLAAFAIGLDFAPAPEGTAGDIDLVEAILFLINAALMLAAIIAVAFLVIGGFRFIISQGDEDQTTKAKNTILYAVIGLIVIGLAAAIVNFVVAAIQSA